MLVCRDMRFDAPCARMRRCSRVCLAVAVLASALVCGCARHPVIPPQPSPPPPVVTRPRPGYDARVDSLDAVDLVTLAGKRIALDPGHGGYFRGSTGVHGLAEAEVNLSVALELRALLEARGAEVMMTRSDDRDFLTRADSSLRADLAVRVRLANEFRADLFVSVHHNADPGGAHDRNEIQTYYKLGDEGPSLDAAASLHRYLKRNLGIERHRILPGNYFVLRNSEAPSVLTEASYLTNPDVEARLAMAEKRRLEAEALFLGVAHYFARPVPAIESFDALAGAGAAPDTLFDGIAGPTLRARVAGSFDVAEMWLDETGLAMTRSDDVLEWRPQTPLAGGAHTARVRVKLAGSGSGRERSIRFFVRRQPSCLVAEAVPERLLRPAGAIQGLRVRALDEFGAPYLDSLRIHVTGLTPGLTPRETTLTARDGVAWGYFRRTTRRAATGRVGLAARIAGVGNRSPIGCRDRAQVWFTAAADSPWTGFVLSMPGGSPVRGAPGTGGLHPSTTWLNRDGFAVLAADSAGRIAAPRFPGYRAWGADDRGPPLVTPIAAGVLHGRRIVIDPDGGGEDHAGMGPSGTRAALVNMDVARALESYLTAAGAEVRLARTEDIGASEVARVRIGEAFRAERYLRIGHRAESAHFGYYFSSAAGRAWARRSVAAFARLGLPSLPIAEDALYPLQQASATALHASLARMDDSGQEEYLNSPGALRAEAYALYVALLGEWAPEADWSADSVRVLDGDGRPVPGAPITLGGTLVVQTGPTGWARFARTEPGPLEVEVVHPRARARAILLDSDRGVILTGRGGQ